MPKEFYPLEKNEVLYTPNVTTFKNSNYQKLNGNDYYSASFIASAAICRPRTIGKNTESPNCDYYNQESYEWMEYKIEQIFQTAYYHKHDSMVMGAFGCGAYGNPSYRVAEIFKKMCLKYYGCFKTIGFAVYSIKDNNFTIFDNVLKF